MRAIHRKSASGQAPRFRTRAEHASGDCGNNHRMPSSRSVRLMLSSAGHRRSSVQQSSLVASSIPIPSSRSCLRTGFGKLLQPPFQFPPRASPRACPLDENRRLLNVASAAVTASLPRCSEKADKPVRKASARVATFCPMRWLVSVHRSVCGWPGLFTVLGSGLRTAAH